MSIYRLIRGPQCFLFHRVREVLVVSTVVRETRHVAPVKVVGAPGVDAAEVLRRCVRDIKDGHWVCGNLFECARWGGKLRFDGCAIGLVGWNSGNSIETDDWVRPFSMVYPGFEGRYWGNPAGWEALGFLFDALPDGERIGRWRADRESAVMTYNDDGGRNGGAPLPRAEALAWFERAVRLAEQVSNGGAKHESR